MTDRWLTLGTLWTESHCDWTPLVTEPVDQVQNEHTGAPHSPSHCTWHLGYIVVGVFVFLIMLLYFEVVFVTGKYSGINTSFLQQTKPPRGCLWWVYVCTASDRIPPGRPVLLDPVSIDRLIGRPCPISTEPPCAPRKEPGSAQHCAPRHLPSLI